MRRLMSILVIVAFAFISSLPVSAQGGRRAWAGQSQKVVTLKGEITNVLKPLASFKSEDDREYKVHLGPVWYWNQEKFELTKGQAELVGETEEVDGELHLYPYKIVQGKTEIVLASEDGIPRWVVRSGRGGRGYGNHHYHRCGRCGSCWN